MRNVDIKLQKAYMLVHLLDIYYAHEPTGGCVHVITDDGNYGVDFAKNCLEYAINEGDYWGECIARLLCEFSEVEQEQIIERPWEISIEMFGK